MNSDTMKMRIPTELKSWVRNEAKKEGRSMNGQLLSLIRSAMERVGSNEVVLPTKGSHPL